MFGFVLKTGCDIIATVGSFRVFFIWLSRASIYVIRIQNEGLISNSRLRLPNYNDVSPCWASLGLIIHQHSEPFVTLSSFRGQLQLPFFNLYGSANYNVLVHLDSTQ
jgi:hypothetical protein